MVEEGRRAIGSPKQKQGDFEGEGRGLSGPKGDHHVMTSERGLARMDGKQIRESQSRRIAGSCSSPIVLGKTGRITVYS